MTHYGTGEKREIFWVSTEDQTQVIFLLNYLQLNAEQITTEKNAGGEAGTKTSQTNGKIAKETKYRNKGQFHMMFKVQIHHEYSVELSYHEI